MNPLTELSDQELIDWYYKGKPDTLSVLVDRYKKKIFTSIYLMVKDRHLAEDLFQDTFFKIVDTLQSGKYKDEGKFLPWAMRIAHNLCIDHFRRVKRSPLLHSRDEGDIFDGFHLSEPAADGRIMKNQTYSTVRKMLDLLPEDQREVIVMRHYADLSFKEIAELMNCSINTALGRMRYGLLNLRKMMSEEQIHCRMI